MLIQEDKQKLWNLIKPIKSGMLTSWDGDSLHSRPMRHVNENLDDGVLMFFTRFASDKVEDMRKYDDVCVAYADTNNSTYVSISGKFEITNDQVLKDKYWNSFVSAWFPEGKDSDNVAILKVHAYEAEFWDSTSSSMMQLFKIAKANMTDTTPDMGENRKLG